MDEPSAMSGRATWKCHLSDEAGALWYIKLDDHGKPPFTVQRHVRAILDIDSDGRLAGVELIDTMPLPPFGKTA